MAHEIIQGDCLDHLVSCDCIFADPPDNIGLGYENYHDRLPDWKYLCRLREWVHASLSHSPVVWFSFNARYTVEMADIVRDALRLFPGYKFKPCQQVFTFYQHNKFDLGNAHRPLYLIRHEDSTYNVNDIKVPSWRELNGDPRAAEGGKVPGDVFDFPRVTGNSKQRRSWHKTQLHEGLVERCIRLTTDPGDLVVDPFGGTGTTLRVCKRIDRRCRLIEIDPTYVRHLREEHECTTY